MVAATFVGGVMHVLRFKFPIEVNALIGFQLTVVSDALSFKYALPPFRVVA
jgi:hypothetical protein